MIERLINARDAAAFLHMGLAELYSIPAEDLPFVLVEGFRQYTPAAIDDFICKWLEHDFDEVTQ